MDSAMNTIEVIDSITEMFNHRMEEAFQGCSFPAAVDLRYTTVIDRKPYGFFEIGCNPNVTRPPTEHPIEYEYARGVGHINWGKDPLRPGSISANFMAAGSIHREKWITRCGDDALKVGPVLMSQFPFDPFFEGNRCLIANLTNQLMRSLSPWGTKKGCRCSKVADHDETEFRNEVPKLPDLFYNEIKRMVDEYVAPL
jgi:hypothetical protein